MLSSLPKKIFFLIILSLALPAVLAAAEFSAQMVLKDKGRLMPGRIFVQDGKMRQEFLDEDGHTITIVRRDKKVVWVIMPFEKKYVEMPLVTKLPGQFLQIPPEAISQRRVCTEEMNGYQVDRVEVNCRGGSRGVLRQTFWVSPKLGMPIKTVCPARQFSVEYKKIREGKQRDRLFEIPPGCRKVAGTTMFP